MVYESKLLSSPMRRVGGLIDSGAQYRQLGLGCFVGKSLMPAYLGILFLVNWTLKENYYKQEKTQQFGENSMQGEEKESKQEMKQQ